MATDYLELNDQQEAESQSEKHAYPEVSTEGIIPERKRRWRTRSSLAGMEILTSESCLPPFESLFRRVVKEELDRALKNKLHCRVETRVLPERIIQAPSKDSRILQLVFKNKLPTQLFTATQVKAEDGSAICVQLLDVMTNQVVSVGPESTAKLQIIVLEGDFAAAEDDDLGPYSNNLEAHHIVKERNGKRPLLIGDLLVTLKEGEGFLGEFQFTDNSSWVRSQHFCLGIKVAPGYCEGTLVRVGNTERFKVKDHRGKSYEKKHPPELDDEVWRLDSIRKDGTFHKHLILLNISTVEQFLRFETMQPGKLRQKLGMSFKNWEATVKHAQTCQFGFKQHIYRPHSNLSIIFNNIFQLVAIIKNQSTHRAADSLTPKEKVMVDKHVKVAYEKWKELIQEYDGGTIEMNPSSQGDGMAGSNTYNQDPAKQPQTYPTQPAQPAQPLPNQHSYMSMESGSSMNVLNQQALLASLSYADRMQGDTACMTCDLVPASLVTTTVPSSSIVHPPPNVSSGSSLQPEANGWQPYDHGQDLSESSDPQGLIIEDYRCQELEAGMMHPGNMADVDTFPIQGYCDENSAQGFNVTSPWFLTAEMIPQEDVGCQRIKSAFPCSGTFKPPRTE
ncbi:unnamed protein product [Sphagnum compactum]